MKKKNIIPLHILFWFIFYLKDFISGKDFSLFVITSYFVNILTFYFNYFIVLPVLIKQKKFLYYPMGFVGIFFFFSSVRFFVEEIACPLFFNCRNYTEGTTLFYYLYDNLYWGSNIIFTSSLIWFLNYAIQSEKEKEKLYEENNKAKMNLLKSQINPHFIFNSLNNIYSLVYQKSDKSLNAIEKLSDLLRFTSNEIEHDFISIINEVQYIESLIELESLRLKFPKNIRLVKEIDDENLIIPPMILIPFVENAFKHGDINDENNPLIIKIKTTDKKLIFFQNNKIILKKKDLNNGVGIKNVKRRLELLYPGRFTLNIENDYLYYCVNLKINL